MNQRFDPNESRPVTSADRITDPVTAAPLGTPGLGTPGLGTPPLGASVDPLSRQSDLGVGKRRTSGATWPLMIIVLAAVVLALLYWLPSGDNTSDTATQPAATEQTAPANTNTMAPATPPAATPPAAEATTPPATNGAAPAAPSTTP